MCVDIDFRLASDWKAEKIPLKHYKKELCSIYNVFFVLWCRCLVFDAPINPNDDN